MAIAKLTPNMIKTLTNLAKAPEASVPEYGTLAMNAAGCTANGLDALARRGLVELFDTGETVVWGNGHTFRDRAYRLTEAGKAEIVSLNTDLNTGYGKANVQSAAVDVVAALVERGMDRREAADLVHAAQDAAWEAGYDAGHAAKA